jgi:DNA-binding response OmpR family regulator
MRKRVLICDDDELLRDLVQYRLTNRGYEVFAAKDGREALDLAREFAPDAMLLDAMMPGVDGYEVLRQLREDPALSKIPVIMLTARKQENDILTALELGADEYMVKPFIPEELVARLSRLIGAPSA